jgi:ABC-type branched-subunit amino acid transport system substrate-binding protein
MNTSPTRSSRRGGALARWSAGLVSMSLLAAACGSDDDATSTSSAASTPATEATAAPDTDPPADTAPPAETGAPDTGAPDTSAPDAAPAPSAAFPDLAPPAGEEIVIGLVNSEGTPGLDFPEIRIDVEAAVDYLNQHGGFGGRPIKLENCAVKGSPETSQACAQELAGKNVEMVLVGLDLFPDYATYTAASIPVIGVLPILPGDYTANALFLTGGNATTTGAMAAVAKDHFGATSVGIVSSDNPGANGTEASLTAALDVAGISHITVKGGDNETDAGYQGLMREAAKDNPDLLVSLYSDDGCIGTIRGRAALGITIPVITTAICSGKSVLDEVGDDALGWSFVGVQTQEDTPELAILQEILSPALGVPPEEVDSTALGLGALGLIGIMSLAMYSNMMEANGDAVTGESLFEFLGSEPGLTQWPSGSAVECGASEKYPTICSFTFPVAEYVEGGGVMTIEGLEAVSAKDYLP